MKKAFAIILSLILLFSCSVLSFADDTQEATGSFGAYDHVFIVGVDGAGRFFKDADTPNFDRIFADGAVDYTARTEMITVSAQNWGSILSGVSYIRHGLTNNKTKEKERSSDTKYPSIFTYARNVFPEAELASYVHWNNINYGIIENDIGVNKVNNNDDGPLTDEICAYFNSGNAPKLFYCHFDSVDHVGHDLGSASEEYISQIETVDGYIGRIYDAIESNGLMDNGLFIVVSDHGHMRAGGHFGITARETNTTLAVKGKTVIAGSEMESDTRNRDVSAIALYALGIDRPAHMSSHIPDGLFDDVSGDKRDNSKDIFDYLLSSLAWLVTLATQ